jgi:adenosylhomocysteine nucleosidase
MEYKVIGIIGAMDEEVNKIKECLSDVTINTVASMDFYEGKLYDTDVVIVRSGIGKVNAGICAQILVDKYKVSAIINTGIAGSLNADINIGDIVLSTDAVQHDMDATAFGYDLGIIPRMEVSAFKADEQLINLAKSACEEVLDNVNVFTGRVVSGDQFISDKSKKDWITENFNGYCTEMEGAAIAQAAYLNNVPFLIIRAISDKADDSAQMDYPTFEAMAISNSVKMLKAMINKVHQ